MRSAVAVCSLLAGVSYAQDGFLPGVTGSPDFWCPVINLGSSPPTTGDDKQSPRDGTFVDLADPSAIAVLHVPGHEERKRAFIRRTREPGWEASRLGFVNGTNAFDPAEHDRMLDNTDVFSQYSLLRTHYASCMSAGDIDSIGAVGSGLGHRTVWQSFLLGRLPGMNGRKPGEDGAPDWVLVLEDDALFVPGYLEKARRFSDGLRKRGVTTKDFDMLVLGWGNKDAEIETRTVGPHSDGVERMCQRWWGLHAYVLSKRGAERLWREHTGMDPAEAWKGVDKAAGADPIYRYTGLFIAFLNAVKPDFVVFKPPKAIINQKGNSKIHHFMSECWSANCILLKLPESILWVVLLWSVVTLPLAAFCAVRRGACSGAHQGASVGGVPPTPTSCLGGLLGFLGIGSRARPARPANGSAGGRAAAGLALEPSAGGLELAGSAGRRAVADDRGSDSA